MPPAFTKQLASLLLQVLDQIGTLHAAGLNGSRMTDLPRVSFFGKLPVGIDHQFNGFAKVPAGLLEGLALRV
jgi:hypothetical protein